MPNEAWPLTPAPTSARESLAAKEDFLAYVQDFLARDNGGKWCVAAVDIEHFKLFNEWYGAESGDALLNGFASYIARCAAANGVRAGYFGNDDFFLIMPDDDAALNELQAGLQKLVDAYESKLDFWVVIGVCSVPQGDAGALTLCDYAQIAAASRTAGSKPINRFAAPLLDNMLQRQCTISELKRALAEHEFFFYLQPKCNSMTRAIIGMEALARWRHPTRGLVPPGEFIPMLESVGLISELDCYIWEQVCAMLHSWQLSGRNLVPISINVSIADVNAIDVPKTLAGLIDKYGLEPKLLPVEITESMLAENKTLMAATIRALHERGFAVLMDDFGSGYSSLNTLKNMDVDLIKLDMKFLDITPQNHEKGVQILESVIDLARKLRLPIVAEGIETQEQVSILQSMDCLYSQGYYFYKPMPIESAETLLEQPATERYWDVHRDLLCRDRVTVNGGHVDAHTAASLHTFHIFADSVLMLALLNLDTGTQHIIKREGSLAQHSAERTENFFSYTEWLVSEKIIHPDDAKKFSTKIDFNHLRQELFLGQGSAFCRFREKVGSEYIWLTMEIQPCRDCSAQNPWAVLMVREDTQANQLSQELVFNSNHDILTGLCNRNRFEMDVRELSCSDYRSIACIYIDVIGLHEINNYLGHEAGDEMLKSVAAAMRRIFSHDSLYRIGGDEFVILMPNRSFYDVWSAADRLRALLKESEYEISLGIQIADDPRRLMDTVTEAETSMRQDKQSYYQRNGKARQLRGLNEKLEQILIEKRDADNFLRVLSPRFKGVYIVDLRTDKMRNIYIPDYFSELIAKANGRFSAALHEYCETLVAPAYRELFMQLCSYDYLRSRLRTGEVIENVYQKIDGSSVYVLVMSYSFDASHRSETLWIFSDMPIRTAEKPGEEPKLPV